MTPQPTAPSASLVAVTDEARATLGGKPAVLVAAFPFKVGREGRTKPFEKLKAEIERRLRRTPQLNDLYLVEPPSFRLHVSREHFAIDYVEGRHVVVDRESACGTIVGGTPIGGDQRARRADLRDGDLIVVGTAESPYVFRFQIERTRP